MRRVLFAVVCAAVAVQGFVFAPAAPPRIPTLRRAEDDSNSERKGNGDRLAPIEETLAAVALGAVMAAGAGVESSALLAGALVGFAAENENQYGFGMLARGIGKVGYSSFKAATEEKPAEDPDLLKPDNFEQRLNDVRSAREEDLREVEATVRGTGDSLADLGKELS
jgi:hypothetical protein